MGVSVPWILESGEGRKRPHVSRGQFQARDKDCPIIELPLFEIETRHVRKTLPVATDWLRPQREYDIER